MISYIVVISHSTVQSLPSDSVTYSEHVHQNSSCLFCIQIWVAFPYSLSHMSNCNPTCCKW